MLGILRTTYKNIEPKNSMKSSLESAMKALEAEKESTIFSQEYIDIIISQLKFYVTEDVIFYALEVRDLLTYINKTFNINNPAEIIK